VEGAGVDAVQVIPTLLELRSREPHGSPVRKGLAPVVLLDEPAVAAHGHGIDQREQDLLSEFLGIARAGPDEELPQRRDSQARSPEGGVVASEEHDQVVQIPEAVVHRRRGEEHEVLLRAAQQPVEGCVPRRVGVPERVGFVHDHQAVRVLREVESALRALPQLAVGGQLLVRDHLARQARLVPALLPERLAELGGRDDQRVRATLARVLLEEAQADLGLPGADPVGVDHSPELLHDPSGASVALLLEPREDQTTVPHVPLGLQLHLLPVELQQGAPEDRLRVVPLERREEQGQELVLERLGFGPQLVEPVQRERHVLGW
jgi:hypothetical protein